MRKTRNYKLTIELLETYQNGAINNAHELLNEAKLLLDHKHFPRTYFLAIASIEETGKAHMAFDARARNLNNDGVCKVIKERFENHSSKITSAFAGWLSYSENPHKDIKTAVDIMIQLKHGREKSMYSDIKPNGVSLSIPQDVVRPISARDAVRLAENCHYYMKLCFQKDDPIKKTSYQDKMFCIKSETLKKILNQEDFWEFYIDKLKNKPKLSWDEATTIYHDNFYKKR